MNFDSRRPSVRGPPSLPRNFSVGPMCAITLLRSRAVYVCGYLVTLSGLDYVAPARSQRNLVVRMIAIVTVRPSTAVRANRCDKAASRPSRVIWTILASGKIYRINGSRRQLLGIFSMNRFFCHFA